MIAGPIHFNKYVCLKCGYETMYPQQKKPWGSGVLLSKACVCPKCRGKLIVTKRSLLGDILSLVDRLTGKPGRKK